MNSDQADREDRRGPRRPLDPESLREFLGSRSIVDSQWLGGGRSNSNYAVNLSDGGRVVVRLHRTDSTTAERVALDLAASLAIVPRVLYARPGLTITTWLNGDRPAITRQNAFLAAKTLARIHQVRFDTCGQLEDGGRVVPWPFTNSKGFFHRMLEDSQVRRFLGPRLVERMESYLHEESHRLAELDRQPCLVHGDYNPGNLLVSDGRVTGVLDWEFAHAGAAAMDWGNLRRHFPGTACDEAIQAGYQDGEGSLPRDWKERAQLIDLSSQLEFLTTRMSDARKRQCVARIRAVVDTA